MCPPLLRSCARPVGDGAQHVIGQRLRPSRSYVRLPFGKQPAKHGPLLFLLAQQTQAFANDIALVAVAALGRFVLDKVNNIVRQAHSYRRHVRIIPVCQNVDNRDDRERCPLPKLSAAPALAAVLETWSH